MKKKENEIIEYLQLDDQINELKETLDLYNKSKEILEKTNIALGRKIEYGVINASSSNTYNIPLHEQFTTNQVQV